MVTDSVSASGLWVLSRSSRHRDHPWQNAYVEARHRLDPPRLSALYNQSTSGTCGVFSRPTSTTTIDPGHTSRLPRIAQWNARHKAQLLVRSSPFPRSKACTIATNASPPDLRWRNSTSGGQGALAVKPSPFRPHLADRRAPRRSELDQQISFLLTPPARLVTTHVLIEFAIGAASRLAGSAPRCR